jgi:hypothetical protein
MPRADRAESNDRIDLMDKKARLDTDEESGPWQFSLRGLLIFVTIVSILLAISVYYLGVLIILIVIGLLQGATLLSADWITRPSHRRWLAFVTSTSWVIVGSSFVILGIMTALRLLNGNADKLSWWVLPISLFTVGAIAFFIARRRWRQLQAHGRVNL